MKFLKKFATRAEYEAYMANNENYPFVGYIADEGVVEYANPVNHAELPLHFMAEEDMVVSFTTNPIQYSLDNEVWVELPVGESTPTIAAGNTIYFKAEGLSPTSSAGIGTFNIVGECNVGGNIMSLLYGDDFMGEVNIEKDDSFYKLFYQQTSIVDAGKMILPATALASYCYASMFYGCTSLVTAPVLPATILASSCYSSMFSGCTSLVNAPVLHATTLASNCCKSMFKDCTSLVNAPVLPAATLVSSCYASMFNGCTNLNYIKAMFIEAGSYYETYEWVNGVSSTGTFVKNAAATWTRNGINGIPTGWTVELAEA